MAEAHRIAARGLPRLCIASLADQVRLHAGRFRPETCRALCAQIDAVLIPGVIDELRTGKVRNGRHSVEKILTATGAGATSVAAGAGGT